MLQMKREEVRFIPVRTGSPYMEIVQENINNGGLNRPQVEVNPLYRFAKEFSAEFDVNVAGYEKTRELLFDAPMNYMAQIDLRQGLSLCDSF